MQLQSGHCSSVHDVHDDVDVDDGDGDDPQATLCTPYLPLVAATLRFVFYLLRALSAALRAPQPQADGGLFGRSRLQRRQRKTGKDRQRQTTTYNI